MTFKGRGIKQLTGKSSMSNSSFGYPSSLPNTITINGSGLGSNTINLSNVTASGFTGYSGPQIASQLASLNPVTFSFAEPNITRYEIVESKEDLLALSATWHRLRTTIYSGIPVPQVSHMLDDNLFSLVTEEDVNHANVIRDYYAKKYTVLALKNIELSEFRKDLKELVYSSGKKFKESLIPLAYRMPEFYEYDVEFEDLLFAYNREVTDFEHSDVNQNKKLSLVKTFMVNNKKSKRKEYWFSDEFNNLVVYYVDMSNPLRGLMDKFIKDDVRVSAIFKKRERDGYEYLKMHSIDFG